MSKVFAVTKDIPITVYVEADDADQAEELANFTPAFDRLYGENGFDKTLPAQFVVGFPYDDIDSEEVDDDLPAGAVVQS